MFVAIRSVGWCICGVTCCGVVFHAVVWTVKCVCMAQIQNYLLTPHLSNISIVIILVIIIIMIVIMMTIIIVVVISINVVVVVLLLH